MKQKSRLVLFLSMLFPLLAIGQIECFQSLYDKGKKALVALDYESAFNSFMAASYCPDMNNEQRNLVIKELKFLNSERANALKEAIEEINIFEYQNKANEERALIDSLETIYLSSKSNVSNCFKTHYNRGKLALSSIKFDVAINEFKAAQACAIDDSNPQLEELAVSSVNLVESERILAFDEALNRAKLETQRADSLKNLAVLNNALYIINDLINKGQMSTALALTINVSSDTSFARYIADETDLLTKFKSPTQLLRTYASKVFTIDGKTKKTSLSDDGKYVGKLNKDGLLYVKSLEDDIEKTFNKVEDFSFSKNTGKLAMLSEKENGSLIALYDLSENKELDPMFSSKRLHEIQFSNTNQFLLTKQSEISASGSPISNQYVWFNILDLNGSTIYNPDSMDLEKLELTFEEIQFSDSDSLILMSFSIKEQEGDEERGSNIGPKNKGISVPEYKENLYLIHHLIPDSVTILTKPRWFHYDGEIIFSPSEKLLIGNSFSLRPLKNNVTYVSLNGMKIGQLKFPNRASKILQIYSFYYFDRFSRKSQLIATLQNNGINIWHPFGEKYRSINLPQNEGFDRFYFFDQNLHIVTINMGRNFIKIWDWDGNLIDVIVMENEQIILDLIVNRSNLFLLNSNGKIFKYQLKKYSSQFKAKLTEDENKGRFFEEIKDTYINSYKFYPPLTSDEINRYGLKGFKKNENQ